MGRLRREGFTISQNCTMWRIVRSVAEALSTRVPQDASAGAALVRRYISTPEKPSYVESRKWVPYVQGVAMTQALERAANPYARVPGDGR